MYVFFHLYNTTGNDLYMQVYLCFLVDCTGSMSPWINEVKRNVKNWSKRLSDDYADTELHVAFVRYTDYDQPEDTRTTYIDFTV